MSKRERFGIICERTDVDAQVIEYGRLIQAKFNEASSRWEVVLQDQDGRVYETYDEFVLYEQTAIEEVLEEIQNKLHNAETQRDLAFISYQQAIDYLAKNRNNRQPNLDKCFAMMDLLKKSENKVDKLMKRINMLEQSEANIMIVLKNNNKMKENN